MTNFTPKENGIANFCGIEVEHEAGFDCGDYVESVGISYGAKCASLAHAYNEQAWSSPYEIPLTNRESRIVGKIVEAYRAAGLY